MNSLARIARASLIALHQLRSKWIREELTYALRLCTRFYWQLMAKVEEPLICCFGKLRSCATTYP